MGLLHLVGFLFFYFFYMPRTCWWATLSKNVWCMERPRKRVHCCLARSTTWLRYSLSLRLNSDALINFSFLFFPPKQHSSITWTACPTMWWRYRCKEGSFFVCFFYSWGKKLVRQNQAGGHNTDLVSCSQLLYLTAAIKWLYLKSLEKIVVNATELLRDVSVCFLLCI